MNIKECNEQGRYCECGQHTCCGHCNLKRSFFHNDEAFWQHVEHCPKRPTERQFDVGAQNDTRFGGTLDETGE